MQPLSTYIKRPRQLWLAFLKKCAPMIPDRPYLQARYLLETGRRLDLENPQRFTEKIQWLKLCNRKPEYTMMVDKLAVKKYVAELIGEKYVVPTLAVWNSFDEIDLNGLPDKFVIKSNNGGGSCAVYLCKDKSTIDMSIVKHLFDSAATSTIYTEYREWPYKDIEPKVFAEAMLDSETPDSDMTDYKFYCFNGVPKYCQVIANRHTKETIDFFDMDWNHQPFVGLNPKCVNANYSPQKPTHFNEMKYCVEKLSADIPFIRIDMYDTANQPYFGEITFFPGSGFGRFEPDDWDKKLGRLF